MMARVLSIFTQSGDKSGPVAILLILNLWFAAYWRTDTIYAALDLMVAVSIWDIFWPANRHCEVSDIPDINQTNSQQVIA